MWHEVFPEWGHACPDDEVLARLEKRVKEIVSRFRESIDIWDVVNEATVAHRSDNAVGRWMADKGVAAVRGAGAALGTRGQPLGHVAVQRL